MRGPQVRFCERRGGPTRRAYSTVQRQPNPPEKEQHQENSYLPFSFSPYSLIKGIRPVSEMLSRREMVMPKLSRQILKMGGSLGVIQKFMKERLRTKKTWR